MSRKPSDFVAKPLGWNECDFLEDFLVGVEIQGHSRVVTLDDLSRGFLHGFGSDTTHFVTVSVCVVWVKEEDEEKLGFSRRKRHTMNMLGFGKI